MLSKMPPIWLVAALFVAILVFSLIIGAVFTAGMSTAFLIAIVTGELRPHQDAEEATPVEKKEVK